MYQERREPQVEKREAEEIMATTGLRQLVLRGHTGPELSNFSFSQECENLYFYKESPNFNIGFKGFYLPSWNKSDLLTIFYPEHTNL